METLQERYYKCLGIIGRFKNEEEVNELDERTRLKYDMCGLALFTQLVAWKISNETKTFNLEGFKLMRPANDLLKILEDDEYRMAKHFMCFNELAKVCVKLVTGRMASFDSLYAEMKDDEKFIELSNLIFNNRRKRGSVKELDTF